MPRDLPLGNGNLLVSFDSTYQIRDLYWPHVGQENHAGGHVFRVGVWVDGQFKWLDDPEWERALHYAHETLASAVRLENKSLQIRLDFLDAVDFHEDVLVRKVSITNLATQARQIRIFFHHDFHIGGNEVGDTAYYEPDRRAILHYKGMYWFLVNGAIEKLAGDPDFEWDPTPDTLSGFVVGVHQFACGLKEIHNLQGTWRDAEDGWLEGGAVAHGSVDSVAGFYVQVEPAESRIVYTWLAAGKDFESVARLNRMIRQRGPQSFIDRTSHYWQLWLDSHRPELEDLPHPICHQYLRSLLILRTQIDNGGAVIAANDTDISSDVRDTYSYMWGRDGALVANALTRAGYIDLPRAFFLFTAKALTNEGYLLHKYNPDGTLASSWHPWFRDGHKDIPVQEDETALVLWALGEHFSCFRDVEFIKPLYRNLIRRAGDFLASYIDPATGLPLPSYDLWEERRGVLGWTAAATWGGLTAAAQFARAFGEEETANRYNQVADAIKTALNTYLWQHDLNRFARMVNQSANGEWEIDPVIDASLVGLWQFGMYALDDPKIIATMNAIRQRLWVKTEIGGVARYENDRYQQVSQDIENVPGNPWFICTLWLSEWYSKTAKNRHDLGKALDLLQWAADRALPSGVLAEQVNPYDGSPLSVSPLTWSHAAFASTVQVYLQESIRLAAHQARGNISQKR